MGIEDDIHGALSDENPQSAAVKSLIKVVNRKKSSDTVRDGTDIELKTDLTNNAVCDHTVLEFMDRVMEMGSGEFNKHCIISDLIDIKERKLLSKDRKSRQEIVEISKRPDEQGMEMRRQENFVKRMFTPRKQV